MKEYINGHEPWLAKRLQVVTATEAASLIGLNPWKSPAQVFRDKKEPPEFFGNEYTRTGQLLEETVIKLTNQVMNTKYELCENEGGKLFITHNSIALGATPDAFDGKQFLECKTTKPLNFLKYRDCPPMYYVVQLMVQMYCADMREGHLAIMSTDLSPRRDLPIVVFRVRLNDQLMKLLHDQVVRFWSEDKTMRVDSKVKRLAELLVRMCYRRVI